MKDNFCIVPWIHLNTEPKGHTKPCCAYDDRQMHWPTLQQMSLEQLWNCDEQKLLRLQFLNNLQPKGCETCFERENSGAHSLRMAINERFEKHIDAAKRDTKKDGTYDDFNLVYWDFRFSNICNFKCRMCGHGCSSSWHDEDEEKTKFPKIIDSHYHGQDLMQYVDKFLPIVEEIYFAGGEPLIMPEHYLILDKLIETQRYDVYLRYNTNMSTLKYKNYDLVEIWKQFSQVDIFASIDGIEENAEYTRHGTDWNRIENNLKKIFEISNLCDDQSNINLYISSTIHIYNIFHFPKLIDKLMEIGISPGCVILCNLIWPDHLKISLLPDHLKKSVKKLYLDHLQRIEYLEIKEILEEKYNTIFYFLDQDSNHHVRNELIRDTKLRDNFRKQSVHASVPELSDWFTSLGYSK